MEVVGKWTGQRAAALQQALRETNEGFARLLDIAPRTVAAWRGEPDIVPSLEMQQLLDVAYERAPDTVRARFALLCPPSEQAVPAAGAQVLRVAIAVVVRGEEVLLVCRRGDDAGGIRWQFPAGVVKPGGRPESVAARETLAETGVHIAVDRALGERTHPITGALCVYYQCSWLAGEASNRDAEENIEAMWVPRDAVARFIPADTLYPPILALLEGTPA